MENTSEVRRILRNSAIFEGLTDGQLAQIEPHLYEVYFHAGSFVIQQGELGTELFIIKEGSVDVLKRSGNGKFHMLATIPQGEVFGELALIDNGYRSASIRANQPTTLLVLTANTLHSLEPEISAEVYKGLAVKLSHRLRFINDITVKSLEKTNKERRNYTAIASCIMLAFLCAIIYSYSLGSTSCLLNSAGTEMTVSKTPITPTAKIMPPVPLQ